MISSKALAQSGTDSSVIAVVAAVQANPENLAPVVMGAFYAASSVPGLLTRYAENAVAKVALSSQTKVIAEEFAPAITVNCVAPGPVGDDHPMRDETRAFPIPRVAQPEEIAALVAFLCSSHAGYMTGLTIPFDGGSDRQMI